MIFADRLHALVARVKGTLSPRRTPPDAQPGCSL